MLFWVLAAAHAGVPEAILLERMEEVAPLLENRLYTEAVPLTEDIYRKVAEGKVVTGLVAVEGHKAKKAYGVAMVDVPIEQMWAGINDETEHTDLIAVNHIEIVRGGVCEDHRRVLMVLPLPIITDRWWIVENSLNPGLAERSEGRVRELMWQSLDDPASHEMSDTARELSEGAVAVAFSRGAWLLVALDKNTTLAEYQNWADPGGKVPAGPASSFAASGITETIEAMAEYARTAGHLQCLSR